MSQQSNEATSQPAPSGANTEEKKGAGNASVSDFARKLAAKQAPIPTALPSAVQQEAKAADAQNTGETKESPVAEVKEQVEAEAKAEPEATETQTEEVLSPETKTLDPKLQEILDRKINKEVAKRYKLKAEMEAKIAELEARITQSPTVEEKEVVVPVPENVPLATINDMAALEQLKVQAKTEIRWAEQWLDEDIPPEGIQTDRGVATKKQLKELIRNARVVQEDLIPAREKFLNARDTSVKTAQEKFPFLKDPSHPGYQMAQAARRDPANAWLRSLPNGEYVLGVQIKGLLAMQEDEAKADVKPSRPKPKPTSGQAEIASDASMSRAPVGVLDKVAMAAERAKITGGKKSLGHKDFAALLLANQKFRNSQ